MSDPAAGEHGPEAERLGTIGATGALQPSTLVVPEDEAAFCVLAADSQALVEEAYARAGVRFERVVQAVETDSQAALSGPSQ